MNIMDFCSKSDHSPEWQKLPWITKTGVMASDGRTLICLKDIGPWPTETDRHPRANILLDKGLNLDYVPLSIKLDKPGKTCKACHGFGRLDVESCNECEEDGSVYFSNGYHEYSFECKNCDGEGYFYYPHAVGKKVCEPCDGFGVIWEPVRISGRLFKYNYLKRVEDICGLEISVVPKEGLMHFRSQPNGISGAIMGMHD